MMRRKNKIIKRIIKLLCTLTVLTAALLLWGKDLYSIILLDEVEYDKPYEWPLTPTVSPIADKKRNTESDPSNSSSRTIEYEAEPIPVSVNIEALYSRNAVLVRLVDQRVLYEKNSDERVYPASLTKIMTVIIAIENLTDLNQSIKLPEEMFETLYEENASLAGFLPGETVPAIDLLYGALLPSGAECCIGLAESICGSEEAFVKLMNEKAKALGMEDTHFANTTGLHSSDHYTTVRNLSMLLEYCLQNNTFKDIFTSQKHYTAPTDLHPGGITLCSTLFQSMYSSGISDALILGGKTGYTSKAGLCLASLAKIEDEEYILVTTAAEGNHYTEQYNIMDALYVYSSLR